jgi:hypothetical protein
VHTSNPKLKKELLLHTSRLFHVFFIETIDSFQKWSKRNLKKYDELIQQAQKRTLEEDTEPIKKKVTKREEDQSVKDVPPTSPSKSASVNSPVREETKESPKRSESESPKKIAMQSSSPTFKTPVGSPSRNKASPTKSEASSPKSVENTSVKSPNRVDAAADASKPTTPEAKKESKSELTTPQKTSGFASYASSSGFAQFAVGSGFGAVSTTKSEFSKLLGQKLPDTPSKELASQVRKFQIEPEEEKKPILEQKEVVTGEENEKLIDSVEFR